MLYGKLCSLRPWQGGDEHALAENANHRDIWRNLRDSFPHPYTLADAEAWVAANEDDVQRPTQLAICVAGMPVGGVGIHLARDEFRYTGEFGYWLGPAHWGRGITTEAVGLATDYWFEAHGLHRIQAFAYTWNPGSRRVLEKNGFTYEGEAREDTFKDGEWVSRWLFGKLAGEAGR